MTRDMVLAVVARVVGEAPTYDRSWMPGVLRCGAWCDSNDRLREAAHILRACKQCVGVNSDGILYLEFFLKEGGW
jgi:hypothetical protein